MRYFRREKRNDKLQFNVSKINRKSKEGVKSFFKKISIFLESVLGKMFSAITKLPLIAKRFPKIVKKNNDKLSQFKEDLADLKVKKSSSFYELVLIWTRDHVKHLSIFIVASVVLLGNLISSEPKILDQSVPQIGFDVMAEPPTATTDLAFLVKTISPFTPNISEDASLVSKKITTEVKLATSGGNFLLKPHILGVRVAHAAGSSGSVKGWYRLHTVQRGESVGSISNEFNIKASAILSANNISDADLITPGQKLRIPVRSGVMHIVSRGESLIGLVNYYKGNLSDTVKINGLKSDQDKTIYAGQKIFIVGGRKPQVSHIASNDSNNSGYSQTNSYARPTYWSGGNHFPYGYCTWYVASKRSVPWHGNANQWLWNAQSMGYSTGRTPQVGAIMVTNESWYGHVAYVEAVHGNSVTISEMNYAGWGRVNYRTLSAWYGQYIY